MKKALFFAACLFAVDARHGKGGKGGKGAQQFGRPQQQGGQQFGRPQQQGGNQQFGRPQQQGGQFGRPQQQQGDQQFGMQQQGGQFGRPQQQQGGQQFGRPQGGQQGGFGGQQQGGQQQGGQQFGRPQGGQQGGFGQQQGGFGGQQQGGFGGQQQQGGFGGQQQQGGGQCERVNGVSNLNGGNSVNIVEDTIQGKLLITANAVPDHAITHDNPNSLCVQNIEASLPLYPSVTGRITSIPVRGAVAYALNGVPIFGPQEAGSENAVESTFFVQCSGHPSPNGQWHYHHPNIGCVGVTNAPDKLVGFALDGFPIYGALPGSKTAVDSQLDQCNGRYVNGEYRYHVRTIDQVDETLPYANSDGSNNWNYILGCYSGM